MLPEDAKARHRGDSEPRVLDRLQGKDILAVDGRVTASWRIELGNGEIRDALKTARQAVEDWQDLLKKLGIPETGALTTPPADTN